MTWRQRTAGNLKGVASRSKPNRYLGLTATFHATDAMIRLGRKLINNPVGFDQMPGLSEALADQGAACLSALAELEEGEPESDSPSARVTAPGGPLQARAPPYRTVP